MKLLLVLFFMIVPLGGSSQPILTADPCISGNDSYTLVVNEVGVEEITAFERYHWVFFKDLYEMKLVDGTHKMELSSCEDGEPSAGLLFYIRVKTHEGFKRYEILPDPDNNDLEYLAKFDPKFSVAEVYDDGRVVVKPREDDKPEDKGCFIQTLMRF